MKVGDIVTCTEPRKSSKISPPALGDISFMGRHDAGEILEIKDDEAIVKWKLFSWLFPDHAYIHKLRELELLSSDKVQGLIKRNLDTLDSPLPFIDSMLRVKKNYKPKVGRAFYNRASGRFETIVSVQESPVYKLPLVVTYAETVLSYYILSVVPEGKDEMPVHENDVIDLKTLNKL
jgi:hypothetical protein